LSQPPGWPRPDDRQGPPGPYQPGPYQPPQQPSYSPPPAYPPYQPEGYQPQGYQPQGYQPQGYQPQGYQPPTAYLPTPPVPPRKRHTGLKITLGVLGGLLVLCGVGGYLVARPIISEYPATLSAPDSVAGLQKLTDPQFQQLSDEMTASLKSTIKASSAIGAFYAPNGDKTHAVLVAGAATLILNPGTQLDGAFQGLASSDLSVSNVGSVDAGSMGGKAECGRAETSGIPIGVCAWVDHGAVGMVIAFSHTPAETADLMRTIRPQVEHRG
jgi:hypothetical protein